MPRGKKPASLPPPTPISSVDEEPEMPPSGKETKTMKDAGPKAGHRGRPSYTLNVPVNRQTLSILETCVTLGQATSTEAVAAKLLARAAEELKHQISQQVSNLFSGKS